MTLPPKRENGKKVSNIEISVDACAELGGQVYDVIAGLRKVYELSHLRNLTYVDTFQGLREKSDGTTPHTLFAFGEPHSCFGRFLHENQQWQSITETAECRKFSQTLGAHILPEMTAPIVDAVEEMSQKIREYVYSELKWRRQATLGGRIISSPDDVEIAIRQRFSAKSGYGKKRHFAEPIIDEAWESLKADWFAIVENNPILRQSDENKKKGMLIDLITSTQESKAIAAALLCKFNPEEARRMGRIPEWVTQAKTIPTLTTLRDSAHHFGHLTFPKNNGIWLQPEVQQAIRYTDLWPWLRKPYMHEKECAALKAAHKNTADRSAISYFMNDLPKKPNASDTLYVLVTHDGPLITDFIKFITGIEKREEKIKDSKKKGVGRQKQTIFAPVSDEEYQLRELERPPAQDQPYSAILTGREFLTFVEREQQRVLKKTPMTFELRQAMNSLSQSIESLRDSVRRDAQSHGITQGGTFANRIRHVTGMSVSH